jgi:hypothetical protein
VLRRQGRRLTALRSPRRRRRLFLFIVSFALALGVVRVARLRGEELVRRLLEEHLGGPLRVDRDLRQRVERRGRRLRRAHRDAHLARFDARLDRPHRGAHRRDERVDDADPVRRDRLDDGDPRAPQRRRERRPGELLRLVLLVRLDHERDLLAPLRLDLVEGAEPLQRAPRRLLLAVADVDHDVGRREEVPPSRREHELPRDRDRLAHEREAADHPRRDLEPVEVEGAPLHLRRRVQLARALRREEVREEAQVGRLPRARHAVVDDADADPLLLDVKDRHVRAPSPWRSWGAPIIAPVSATTGPRRHCTALAYLFTTLRMIAMFEPLRSAAR